MPTKLEELKAAWDDADAYADALWEAAAEAWDVAYFAEVAYKAELKKQEEVT
jgi:hypothetical protein